MYISVMINTISNRVEQPIKLHKTTVPDMCLPKTQSQQNHYVVNICNTNVCMLMQVCMRVHIPACLQAHTQAYIIRMCTHDDDDDDAQTHTHACTHCVVFFVAF